MKIYWTLMFTLMLAPGLGRAACSVAPTPIAFGIYSPFNAVPTDSAGTLRVSCDSVTVGYTVLLSTGSAGVYSSRSMSGGGYVLAYNLYADALRSVVWGDGSGGTTTVSGAFSLPGAIDHSVYGRMSARQNVGAGTYTDAITVTINF